MINLKQYKQLLLQGDWHIHSTYTDGKSSLKNIVRIAERRKIKAIAITEHVRKELDYDFSALLDEIETLKNSSKVMIFSGIEAKVLNKKGELDLPKKFVKNVDVVLGAFHSFNFSSSEFWKRVYEYEEALIHLIKNKLVTIWAHPFSQPYEKELISKIDFCKILKVLKKRTLVIEINLKSFSIPQNFLNSLLTNTKVLFSIGSNAHSASEIWNGCRPKFINAEVWKRILKKNS